MRALRWSPKPEIPVYRNKYANFWLLAINPTMCLHAKVVHPHLQHIISEFSKQISTTRGSMLSSHIVTTNIKFDTTLGLHASFGNWISKDSDHVNKHEKWLSAAANWNFKKIQTSKWQSSKWPSEVLHCLWSIVFWSSVLFFFFLAHMNYFHCKE